MTKPGRSIAELVEALEQAAHAYRKADTPRLRKARLDRVMHRGVALRERLQELRVWLDEGWHREENEERYADFLAKYETGWAALNSVEPLVEAWLHAGYIELDAEEFHARLGLGGLSRNTQAKSGTSTHQVESRSPVLRRPNKDRGEPAGRTGGVVPESLQLALD